MKKIFDNNNDQPEVQRIAHPEVISSRTPVVNRAHGFTRMVLEKSYADLFKVPQATPIPDTIEPVVEEPQTVAPDTVIDFAQKVVQAELSEVDQIRASVEASYDVPEAA